jgi:hypothetical protein
MSRSFGAWHDTNSDLYPAVLPLPFDLTRAERDTALSTPRDIAALCAEDLADAEARHRGAAIASATLEALGEAAGGGPAPEVLAFPPADAWADPPF